MDRCVEIGANAHLLEGMEGQPDHMDMVGMEGNTETEAIPQRRKEGTCVSVNRRLVEASQWSEANVRRVSSKEK